MGKVSRIAARPLQCPDDLHILPKDDGAYDDDVVAAIKVNVMTV
jgi:hypothetical protein